MKSRVLFSIKLFRLMGWFFCLLPTKLWAQDAKVDGLEDEFALLEEEQKVYTAAKHEQDILDSPSSITVITRDQIENSYCSSVSCLLQQVPEVGVYRFHPMHSHVVARAITWDVGDRTLALVDGREVNLEFVGPPFWEALPIHMNDIERIEIVRGPGSALYGANAFSGVVSMITRKEKRTGAEVLLGVGENGVVDCYGHLDLLLGDWAAHFSMSREQSGNAELRHVNEREINRLTLQVDRDISDSSFHAEAGFYTPNGLMFATTAPMKLNETKMFHILADYKTKHWQERISFFHGSSDMNIRGSLFYNGMKMGEVPKIYEMNFSTFDFDLQSNWELFKGNLLITGAAYRWNNFISKNNNPEDNNQHRLGIFVHDEQRLWQDLLLTGGVRLDYNTVTALSLSPQLVVAWRLGQNQLRASFSTAFRKPRIMETSLRIKGVKGISGIEEFFENGPGTDGLKNEKVITWEIGYRGSLLNGRLCADLDLYYNQYRDSITFYYMLKTNSLGFPDLANSVMMYRNDQLEADAVGGSASLTYRLKETLLASINYTYQYAFYLTDPLDFPWTQKGGRVPFVPVHMLNLLFQYTTADGLHVGMGMHYFSEKEDAVYYKGSIFNPMVRNQLPQNFVYCAFISYRLLVGGAWFETGVRAFNLFNSGYYSYPPNENPSGENVGGEETGRSVWLFVRAGI